MPECETCGWELEMFHDKLVGHRCAECDEDISEHQCKEYGGMCKDCMITFGRD